MMGISKYEDGVELGSKIKVIKELRNGNWLRTYLGSVFRFSINDKWDLAIWGMVELRLRETMRKGLA